MLQVDERRLMSEREPPVGLKHFLYAQLLRCGVVQHEPFASCCRESILGSCAPRFLWLRLMKVCKESAHWLLHGNFRVFVIIVSTHLPCSSHAACGPRLNVYRICQNENGCDRVGLSLYMLNPFGCRYQRQ